MHIGGHAVDCLYIGNASLFKKYHYVRGMVVMVSVLSSRRCMATSIWMIYADWLLAGLQMSSFHLCYSGFSTVEL